MYFQPRENRYLHLEILLVENLGIENGCVIVRVYCKFYRGHSASCLRKRFLAQ